MEEKNTTNPSEKNESKQSSKKSRKNEKPGFSETLKDYKAEFQKIIWPKRSELGKKTVTVIVTSLLMGVIITCMDTVYTVGYDFLLSLLG